MKPKEEIWIINTEDCFIKTTRKQYLKLAKKYGFRKPKAKK